MTETIDKESLKSFVLDWTKWLFTRRFYAPPLPKNILEIMQHKPGINKVEPNAENSALCAAFNLVMTNAPDSERLPFLYVYLKPYRPAPIKTLAHQMGVNSDTIYQRAHEAATKFYAKSLELEKLHEQLQKEIDGFID